MLIATLISICAFSTLAAGELSAGIYRIANPYNRKSLAGQFDDAIHAFGNIDDARVTWFVAPAAGHADDAYTIQNVKSLQYLSISGAPANGSILVPSNAPFVWTYNAQRELGVGTENLTVGIVGGQNLALLARGTDGSQKWDIAGVQPYPATYLIRHRQTQTYLTGPAMLPGRVTAARPGVIGPLQYWTLAGTSAGSHTGTLTNVPTGGVLSIANGTVTAAASSVSSAWSFEIVDGGYRLTSDGYALAVTQHRRVVAEPENEHSERQVFVFVPGVPAKKGKCDVSR